VEKKSFGSYLEIAQEGNDASNEIWNVWSKDMSPIVSQSMSWTRRLRDQGIGATAYCSMRMYSDIVKEWGSYADARKMDEGAQSTINRILGFSSSTLYYTFHQSLQHHVSRNEVVGPSRIKYYQDVRAFASKCLSDDASLKKLMLGFAQVSGEDQIEKYIGYFEEMDLGQMSWQQILDRLKFIKKEYLSHDRNLRAVFNLLQPDDMEKMQDIYKHLCRRLIARYDANYGEFVKEGIPDLLLDLFKYFRGSQDLAEAGIGLLKFHLNRLRGASWIFKATIAYGSLNHFGERWNKLPMESRDKIWHFCISKSFKQRALDAKAERHKFKKEEVDMERKRMNGPSSKGAKHIHLGDADLCASFEEVELHLGAIIDDEEGSMSILYLKKQLLMAKNLFVMNGYFMPAFDSLEKQFEETLEDALLLECWRFFEWKADNKMDIINPF